MGMNQTNGDYLTGMLTGPRPAQLQMANFLGPKTGPSDPACRQSQKQRPGQFTQASAEWEPSALPGVQRSGAADIVELIQSTRNHFEQMIAVVRKRQPDPQKAAIKKESDLEPLTGGIAHIFGNLFMAIQGRISLMLLRSGPAHPFFVQLKRMEKLVQCESALANDILPHIAGRYFPLDSTSRRQLLDEIARIPLQLGVKCRLNEIETGTSQDSELKPAEFQKLTGAVTCILNLLLSEINQLTVFMMSQTASAHSDFNRLLGIKAYVQKGYDRIRDLYECTGLTSNSNEPTRPQRLAEIVFDSFFKMDTSLRLNITVATDLWGIKAEPEQVTRIVNGLCSLATTKWFKRGNLHVTATNACALDNDASDAGNEGYVVLSLGVANQLTGIHKKRAGQRKKPARANQPIDKDVHLDGISGLIRSLGGRLSTICPPGAGTAFNVFLPALPPEKTSQDTPQDNDLNRKVVYLKSDRDTNTADECIEPCLVFYKVAYSQQDKTASSSI